jgi:lipoprotein-releasing system ATP-binding protein
MPDLDVRDIRKEYPTRAEPLLVLRSVTLSLAAGESLAILGPSGSGKTTLLSILGTLDRPTSGTVRIGGVDPFALGEADLARFRNRRIGFVFQDHFLLPQLNVSENVLLPTIAEGPASNQSVDRARDLIHRVGLEERISHRPAELSGGERQRVALARALVQQPLVVLADEPTGNLDRTTAARIANLLIELQAEERFVLVVVTHSLELAAGMQQRKALDDGVLRDLATPANREMHSSSGS